ncbi:MAG: hypothetical protein P8J50_10340 [Acidimicrobiales bacterium]|jgi:hypothetical protein|nr:hypothetical protein [Acidimicrobiales bacterium]
MAGRGFGPAFVKRTIRMNGIRKGLLGGSRFWLVIFGLGYVARWSGKVTKRGEMPIRYSEKLKPGESIVISHTSGDVGSA